jgi:hypothetical protein
LITHHLAIQHRHSKWPMYRCFSMFFPLKPPFKRIFHGYVSHNQMVHVHRGISQPGLITTHQSYSGMGSMDRTSLHSNHSIYVYGRISLHDSGYS